MKITRFDKIEYSVLETAELGWGYYPTNTEYGERALLLMKEGIMVKNSVKNWPKSGYKGLTEEGKKYYKSFMRKVARKHGHKWELDDSKKPNRWAMLEGYHNGFKCVKCGFEFCVHCKTEMEIPVCTKK